MKNKKEIRNKFRSEVLSRDEFKCVVCGKTGSKLDAHHITNRNLMPGGGYVKENGISLCDLPNGCHWKAELFSKYNSWFLVKEYGESILELSPENLYKRINSNYDLAYRKSSYLK